MADDDAQRIDEWRVLDGRRLSGNVYNRPGHFDGSHIVTTPVVEIRIMGRGWPDTYPVAFTESGSVYRLGKPSRSFGMDRAHQFVSRSLGIHVQEPVTREPKFEPDRTIVRASVDTCFGNLECIDVYETSFRPI